jgi:uncharacterized membrane protein YphA (DoxX/SURF4 family)
MPASAISPAWPSAFPRPGGPRFPGRGAGNGGMTAVRPFAPARRKVPGRAVLQAWPAGQVWAMPVLRAVARPLLASIFAVEGGTNLLHPQRVSAAAEPVVRPVAERVPAVPADPEQAVRINGAIQLAGATLLAAGRVPRVSALAIAATLVPTTLAGHRFWESDDPQERAQQRIQFLKNLALLGGLLLAAADTAGAPSLAWRGRHAAKEARRDAARTARTAKVAARAGARAGRLSARRPGH